MGKGIVKLGEGQWAVKDGNLLAVKESNSRFLNTEFTVTRGTGATYIGRDGLIKESNLQDTNLLLNGDFEELGDDLVDNGDFALGDNGDWNLSIGDAVIEEDVAKFPTSTNTFIIQSSVVPASVKTYKLTYDIISTNGNTFRLAGGSSAFGLINLDSATTGTKTAYITSNGTKQSLQFNNNAFIGSIDNVSLKEVDPNDRWSLNATGGSSALITDKLTLSCDDGDFVNASQSYSFVNGNTYRLSFDLTADNQDENFTFRDDGGGLGGLDEDISLNFGGTETKTFIFTANTNSDSIYIKRNSNATYSWSIDNISVQEVKTATPRIDFTNNTDGHLLLEPERTNLITYSEDFNDSYWIPTGASVSLSTTTSPDGLATSYKLIPDNGTGGNRSISKQFNGLSNNHTHTCFAKKGEYNYLMLRMRNNPNVGVMFDLENGTFNLNNPGDSYVDSEIESIGNGWYRCSITLDPSQSVTVGQINISMSVGITGSETHSFNGDGTSGIYIWGCGFEEGSYATSYIPTHGSTTTRAADTCVDAGTSQDFNSTEGVLFAEMAALADDETNREITLSDGSTTNYVLIRFNNGGSNRIYTRVDVNAGGGVQYYDLDTGHTITDVNKIAIRWDNSNFVTFINGVKVGSQLSGSSFSADTLNELNFNNGTGGNNFYGKVKQLQVYKEALNGTRLTHLTGTLGTDFYESYAEMASALTYTIQ